MLDLKRVGPLGMLGIFLATMTAQAQQTPNQFPQAPQTPSQNGPDDQTIRFVLPTVTVTAQKEPENVEESPVSVTAVTTETLQQSGATSVSEAAQFAPNTFFTEFTARKLSIPSFRGIGSSNPNNPAVTTYIDGVPQLNASSSSIELVGVDQIEFVRGPQSALFGRNTLGGLINITSVRPSLTDWSGDIAAPFGNFDLRDVRGTVSGPLMTDTLALGVSAGYSGRDGFTRNDVTGHNVDSRSAAFGKVQLRWTPAPNWEVRGLLSGERARDGDYALYDLGALRADPFHVSHAFDGLTDRDIVAPTGLVSYTGRTIDFSATTGFVSWKTQDLTGLNYTALPLITRDDNEQDHQFTQELRLASAKNAPLAVSDRVGLKWQTGIFLFTQNYAQDAVNSYAPLVLSPLLAFPVAQTSPQSSLDDRGIGVYGAGTLTFGSKLDLTIGVRTDRENKTASLNTFYSPAIAPAAAVDAERDFTDVSPQFTVAYHPAAGQIVYATAARGFKAGGFNAASPAGSESYGEEHSWNYEGGAKSSWLGQRLAVNGAVFYLNWSDLQVNVPNPLVPAQFYVANAGRATSKGAEVEVTARPLAGLDVFGGIGYTNARFGSGSVSGGVNVGGNRLSNAPDYTINAGVEYSREVAHAVTLYARGELVAYGDYEYDDANTVGQSAYSLANFRGGARRRNVFAEAWVRNAFNTVYIPVAFAYPGLAPSGFVGEDGPPRTFGIRAGVMF